LYIKYLKLLLGKELFRKFLPLIDSKALKEENREISFLFTTLVMLHESTDADVSCDELETFFWVKYPDAAHDIYDGLFSDLRALDISDAVAEAVVDEIQRQKTAVKLSEAAFEFSQGRGSLEQVKLLTESLNASPTSQAEQFEFVDMDLEHLMDKVVHQPGLRWRLNCLNKAMGSLRKGNFGFLFARPETGKTTFLASEVAHMLDQTDKPIIWFNNEQVDEEVGLRLYQAYFGITLDVLKANIGQYKKLFNQRVGKKFVLVPSVNIDCGRIERIVHAVNPALIIYDQIDKIKGFKADRDDLVYGAIYQWARELSKSYAPTIGVCQADGTAEGQKWLTMGNVANAKTSKQAEADWIIGIGKTSDPMAEYVRYLSICKNKLIGDEDSISNLRHGHFETLIQPEIGRYKDIVEYK
jgi:replicative DNA helicase